MGFSGLLLMFAVGLVEANEPVWTQAYIADVPPMMMKDPFLELLGQTNRPVPYTYEEAVKLAGHSCGAVAGAWVMTRKALEVLYPGEVPVRGQIMIEAPGAEDEWIVGVFGEVMTYMTGASPETGFPGGPFGPGYKRRGLLIYKDAMTNTPPSEMVWKLKRIDTGAQVNVKYDLSLIQPPSTPDRGRMIKRMVNGEATPDETRDWIEYWNARVKFIFENADTLEGLFTVEKAVKPLQPE